MTPESVDGGRLKAQLVRCLCPDELHKMTWEAILCNLAIFFCQHQREDIGKLIWEFIVLNDGEHIGTFFNLLGRYVHQAKCLSQKGKTFSEEVHAEQMPTGAMLPSLLVDRMEQADRFLTEALDTLSLP